MKNNKLFTNWETPQLFDHLYFLENEVYTTRNQYMIHEIKSILKLNAFGYV